MGRLAPHTLVSLQSPDVLLTSGPLPDWVTAMLAATPVVIVRRGPQTTTIPVGIRGYQKSQRFAAAIMPTDWQAPVTPAMALNRLPELTAARRQLPAFQKLARVQSLLSAYDWGVGGSLQFELATGLPMVNPNSDLDIIMQRPAPMSPAQALQLIERLKVIAGAHADIQVVHGQLGFSLEEYANQRASQIMMKTAHGPILVTDPWHAEERDCGG